MLGPMLRGLLGRLRTCTYNSPPPPQPKMKTRRGAEEESKVTILCCRSSAVTFFHGLWRSPVACDCHFVLPQHCTTICMSVYKINAWATYCEWLVYFINASCMVLNIDRYLYISHLSYWNFRYPMHDIQSEILLI